MVIDSHKNPWKQAEWCEFSALCDHYWLCETRVTILIIECKHVREWSDDAKDHEGDGPMDNSAKDLQAIKNSATKENEEKLC